MTCTLSSNSATGSSTPTNAGLASGPTIIRWISLVPSRIVKIVDYGTVSTGQRPARPVVSARIQHGLFEGNDVSDRPVSGFECGSDTPRRHYEPSRSTPRRLGPADQHAGPPCGRAGHPPLSPGVRRMPGWPGTATRPATPAAARDLAWRRPGSAGSSPPPAGTEAGQLTLNAPAPRLPRARRGSVPGKQGKPA
jgi:hypothetical protein